MAEQREQPISSESPEDDFDEIRQGAREKASRLRKSFEDTSDAEPLLYEREIKEKEQTDVIKQIARAEDVFERYPSIEKKYRPPHRLNNIWTNPIGTWLRNKETRRQKDLQFEAKRNKRQLEGQLYAELGKIRDEERMIERDLREAEANVLELKQQCSLLEGIVLQPGEEFTEAEQVEAMADLESIKWSLDAQEHFLQYKQKDYEKYTSDWNKNRSQLVTEYGTAIKEAQQKVQETEIVLAIKQMHRPRKDQTAYRMGDSRSDFEQADLLSLAALDLQHQQEQNRLRAELAKQSTQKDTHLREEAFSKQVQAAEKFAKEKIEVKRTKKRSQAEQEKNIKQAELDRKIAILEEKLQPESIAEAKLSTELEQLKDALAEQGEAISTLEYDLRTTQSEREDLRDKLKTITQKIAELDENISQKSLELERARGEQVEAEKKKREQAVIIGKAKRKAEAAQKKLERLEYRQVRGGQNAPDALLITEAQTETDAANAALDEALTQAGEYDDTLREAKQESSTISQALNLLQNKKDTLVREGNDIHTHRILEANKEIEALMQKLDKSKQAAAKFKTTTLHPKEIAHQAAKRKKEAIEEEITRTKGTP